MINKKLYLEIIFVFGIFLFSSFVFAYVQNSYSPIYNNAMGINLFNMGIDVSLNELRSLTGNNITLMGNLPPRDVLAAGTPDEVERGTIAMLSGIQNSRRILPSCGGGMPPEVSAENIRAFLKGIASVR